MCDCGQCGGGHTPGDIERAGRIRELLRQLKLTTEQEMLVVTRASDSLMATTEKLMAELGISHNEAWRLAGSIAAVSVAFWTVQEEKEQKAHEPDHG